MDARKEPDRKRVERLAKARDQGREWARHVGVELDTIRLVRATGVPEQFAEEYPDLLQSASAVRGLD